MEKTTIELPSMYGDHHVIEVRRILLEMPGVKDVSASSGFQVVEVDYDPKKTGAADIKAKLEEAGYTHELSVAVETGEAAYQGSNGDSGKFFRHSAAFEPAAASRWTLWAPWRRSRRRRSSQGPPPLRRLVPWSSTLARAPSVRAPTECRGFPFVPPQTTWVSEAASR